MKKVNKKHSKMVTRTIEQIENRKITKAERERLRHVAALPDDRIDTSDIPEIKDSAGWVRVHEHPEHRLNRVLSRLLSIRLPEPTSHSPSGSPNPRVCHTRLTSSRCCMKRSNGNASRLSESNFLQTGFALVIVQGLAAAAAAAALLLWLEKWRLLH